MLQTLIALRCYRTFYNGFSGVTDRPWQCIHAQHVWKKLARIIAASFIIIFLFFSISLYGLNLLSCFLLPLTGIWFGRVLFPSYVLVYSPFPWRSVIAMKSLVLGSRKSFRVHPHYLWMILCGIDMLQYFNSKTVRIQDELEMEWKRLPNTIF